MAPLVKKQRNYLVNYAVADLVKDMVRGEDFLQSLVMRIVREFRRELIAI